MRASPQMLKFKRMISWLYQMVTGRKGNNVRKNAARTKIPIHGSHIDTYNCFRFAKFNRRSSSSSKEETEEIVE